LTVVGCSQSFEALLCDAVVVIVVDVGPGGGDRAALPTAGPLFYRWGRGRGGGGGGEEVGCQGFRFVFIPEITSPFKLCIQCKKICLWLSVLRIRIRIKSGKPNLDPQDYCSKNYRNKNHLVSFCFVIKS
jgi:hypothetical protein